MKYQRVLDELQKVFSDEQIAQLTAITGVSTMGDLGGFELYHELIAYCEEHDVEIPTPAAAVSKNEVSEAVDAQSQCCQSTWVMVEAVEIQFFQDEAAIKKEW